MEEIKRKIKAEKENEKNEYLRRSLNCSCRFHFPASILDTVMK